MNENKMYGSEELVPAHGDINGVVILNTFGWIDLRPTKAPLLKVIIEVPLVVPPSGKIINGSISGCDSASSYLLIILSWTAFLSLPDSLSKNMH